MKTYFRIEFRFGTLKRWSQLSTNRTLNAAKRYLRREKVADKKFIDPDYYHYRIVKVTEEVVNGC